MPGRVDTRPGDPQLRRPTRPRSRAGAPYREGVLGHPVIGQPADRPDAGRPRPRRARLQGPRPARAPTTRSCPSSPNAGPSTPSGKTWTFQLRDGRDLAGRRAGHGRRRRVHRPGAQDPAYTGPVAGSWHEVTATAIDAARRSVHAHHAARRLPAGGDPADASRASPRGRARRGARDEPVRPGAGRHRAVRRSASSTTTDARARAGCDRSTLPASDAAEPPDATSATTRPLACAAHPAAVPVPRPAWSFASSTARTRSPRRSDAARSTRSSGLPPAVVRGVSRRPPGAGCRVPASDADGRPAQPAPRSIPSCRARVRNALLEAIDRSAIVRDVFGSAAAAASDPIPPTSWAFDARRRPRRSRSTRSAATAAQGGRLDRRPTAGGRRTAQGPAARSRS